MPLFKVQEHRYIHTDHIADISFQGGFQLEVRSMTGEPEKTISSSRIGPSLKIILRSGQQIDLVAEEAQQAWAAFQQATDAFQQATDGKSVEDGPKPAK
jgi:hypothetical protein